MGKAEWVKGDFGRLGIAEIRSNLGDSVKKPQVVIVSVCMLDSLDASSPGAMPANRHPDRQPTSHHRLPNVDIPPPVLILSISPTAEDRSISEIVGVDLSALPPVQPAVVFPDRVSLCSSSSSSYTSGLGSLSFFLGILSAPHTGPPSLGSFTDGPQEILVRLAVVGGFEVWVVLLIVLRDAVVV